MAAPPTYQPIKSFTATDLSTNYQIVYNNTASSMSFTMDTTTSKSEWERYKGLPVVEYHDGPVYMWDNYYADIDEALDAVAEADKNPAYQIVWPCIEDKAQTPCADEILEWVDEVWAENFEDYDGDPFTHEVRVKAAELVEALQKAAPTCWTRDITQRIALADEDLDQEYDPAEDTYE